MENLNVILLQLVYIILAIVFILCVNSLKIKQIKDISLFLSVIIFLISLIWLIIFDKNVYNYQFVIYMFSTFNFDYTLGIDGISLFLIILTNFLTIICVLLVQNDYSNSVNKVKAYFILLFLTQFFLLNAFLVLNLFWFFLSFEGVAIPMALLIGSWGSRERRILAAYMFLMYTLIGSISMFLCILYVNKHMSLNFYSLEINAPSTFSIFTQSVLFLLFFISLAVKVPIYPFHAWLPEAHVEASTPGSVLLAGVMLKLGLYGFLRVLIPFFPYGSLNLSYLVSILCIISILYSSIIIFRQIDLKKIVAYSSIVHMNSAVLGLFSFTFEGVEGGLYMMLTHGIISAGMFASIGMLYDRYKTRNIMYYSGIATVMPVYAILFFILILSNMGLPPTAGFASEIMLLIGVGKSNLFGAIIILFGAICCSIYSIRVYTQVFFGPLNNIIAFADLNKNEFLILFLLCLLSILGGLFCGFFTDYLDITLINLLVNFENNIKFYK